MDGGGRGHVVTMASFEAHRISRLTVVGLVAAIALTDLIADVLAPEDAKVPLKLAIAAIGVVVGTLAVTTVAGAAFGWLRLRSGSVIAPMMAHLATNSFAYVAATTTV